MLRVNSPVSLETLRRCRVEIIGSVKLHRGMFWGVIIVPSKKVQWSVLCICQVLSYIAHLYLLGALWSINFHSYFKDEKCKAVQEENGQHQFWIFLQFKDFWFGICIENCCQFTEIGPTSNWPMGLPKNQENVIQEPKHGVKEHTRENKISY